MPRQMLRMMMMTALQMSQTVQKGAGKEGRRRAGRAHLTSVVRQINLFYSKFVPFFVCQHRSSPEIRILQRPLKIARIINNAH